MKSNRQDTGDNSIAASAGRDVIITTGVTVADVATICREMMRETMVGLQREAFAEVERRSEQLLESFFSEARARFGEQLDERLSEFKDPGAQYAFRQAQAGYCRYGDEEAMGDAVRLIVDRMDASTATFQKIVIDEAIEKCSKITRKQSKYLCLLICLFSQIHNSVNSINRFTVAMKFIGDLADCLPLRDSELSALSALGVINVMHNTNHWKPVDEIIRARYWGLCSKGISAEDLGSDFERWNKHFMPSIRVVGRYQQRHMFEASWKELIRSDGGSDEDVERLTNIVNKNMMSVDEVGAMLDEISPGFSKIRNEFSSKESAINYCELTAVGRAIAYAASKDSILLEEASLEMLI